FRTLAGGAAGGWSGLHRCEPAHSPTRARARSQGEGPCGGRGSAGAKKNDRARGTGRGRRHRRTERQLILTAIERACASGARLDRACQVVGISCRTLQRWREDPEADDRRYGPHRRPQNALRPSEEAQILTVMVSSRFAHLSPKQLVPQLADEGLYLASESTLYRLQRRHGLRAKRRVPARTPCDSRNHSASGCWPKS